jgi:hypothetical protein
MSLRHNVQRDKTSSGTKHPEGKNVQQDNMSSGTKRLVKKCPSIIFIRVRNILYIIVPGKNSSNIEENPTNPVCSTVA